MDIGIYLDSSAQIVVVRGVVELIVQVFLIGVMSPRKTYANFQEGDVSAMHFTTQCLGILQSRSFPTLLTRGCSPLLKPHTALSTQFTSVHQSIVLSCLVLTIF